MLLFAPSIRAIKYLIVLALVASAVISFVTKTDAHADILGPDNMGYYRHENVYYFGMGSAYVIPNGLWAYSPDELITSLKNSYNSGGQNGAGAAFVVHTMLGITYYSANRPRTVSAAEWTDLKLRLDSLQAQGKINWNKYLNLHGTSYGSDKFEGWFNGTYYGTGNWDVAAHSQWDQQGDAIEIDTGGGTYYRIFHVCANPAGNSSPLPEALDYDLTPTISGTPSSSEGGGSKVTLTPTVDNTGLTSSAPVQWQVTSFRVDKGGAVPIAATNGQTPTDYYKIGGTKDVATVPGSSGSGTGKVFPKNSSSLANFDQTIGDYDVGTKICYGFSVQPYSHVSTNWRHSTPFCVTISKKPKVQVLGGDLRVGQSLGGTSQVSDIVSSTTLKAIVNDQKTFGSWTEYGVIATGSVSGMAAGSGYAGGLKNATVCGVNLLTFSNTDGASCSAKTKLGSYMSNKSIPNVANAFPVTSATPNFVSLGDTTKRRVETATSDISIDGGVVEKGDWLVINAPDKTVEITKDIMYTAQTLYSLNDIPQLVIIANKINIQSGVGRIDAWLIASGNDGVIDTCSDVAVGTKLTSKLCDKTLHVNGPVMAKSLLLRRTAGAGLAGASGDPAEVFTMHPDAYLWSITRAKAANRVQSVYTRELPPRF